jgi:arylsulfatase A-like enzyme
MDVYPTLLGLAGFSVAPERGVDGADLSAALLGHEPPPELRAWSHTTVLVRGVFKQMRHPKWSHVWQRAARYFPDEDPRWIWAAVRDGDRFLELRRPPDGDFRFEAFDLATDPGELRDLFDSSDPEQRGAAAELAAYKERLVAGFRGRARRAPLPAGAEERMLRSLGYIR